MKFVVMHPATLTRSILVLLILLLGSGFFWGPKKANRVAVRADARKEYTLLRALDDTAKVQTYHLIKGKYFGGNVDDRGLEETTFPEIAEHISLNLRRQKYFPEEDPAAGDLLIMVHYGATFYIDDPWDGNEFALGDSLSSVSTTWGEVYDYNLSGKVVPEFDGLVMPRERSYVYGLVLPSQRGYVIGSYVRAKILGLYEIFSATANDYEAHIQSQLASEGRYFFVLTAFDLPLLRKGEKKVMWSTRYSIRSIGQPYAQAIKELNLVAGHYFGKNIKELISKRATDKSIVEFGEIEVLSQEID